MKTYAKFTGFLWIAFCFGIVLLAGAIEEGPKLVVEVNSAIEQKETVNGKSTQIMGDSRDTITDVYNGMWDIGRYYTP